LFIYYTLPFPHCDYIIAILLKLFMFSFWASLFNLNKYFLLFNVVSSTPTTAPKILKYSFTIIHYSYIYIAKNKLKENYENLFFNRMKTENYNFILVKWKKYDINPYISFTNILKTEKQYFYVKWEQAIIY
jgi:hypothetical protein